MADDKRKGSGEGNGHVSKRAKKDSLEGETTCIVNEKHC